MLKQLSKFVLEVLPYMLSALIVAIVVPGFLMSQLHGNQQAGDSNTSDRTICARELAHDDHTLYSPRQTLSRRFHSAVDEQGAK